MRGGLALLLAGGAIGAAVAIVILNSESEPQYATGHDGIERAAGKTFGWGAKQRTKGKVRSVAGAVKEGVKDAAGEVGTAAAQTLHDLNK